MKWKKTQKSLLSLIYTPTVMEEEVVEKSQQARPIHVPNKVSLYVLQHISCERDRTQALNLIKTFNSALLNSDSVPLSFGLVYESVQPSYCLDFYTGELEVPFPCLRTVLDIRQVQDIEVCPRDIYGPGYVRLSVSKLRPKRKREESGELSWSLERVKLDSIPEMGEWASETDRQIATELLECTYGMHPVMPLLRCSILHRPHAQQYTILCEPIPSVPYAFLAALARQFPTYLKQISLNVERLSLRYTVRRNESPLTALSLLPHTTTTTAQRKRVKTE